MSDCFTIEQQKELIHLCDDVLKIIESKIIKQTTPTFDTNTTTSTNETSENSSDKAVTDTAKCSDVILDQSEIILLTDFIISWNQRRCECLLRQHLDKLPILIQHYLTNVTSVITSFWKQIVELDVPQTTTQEDYNHSLRLYNQLNLLLVATAKCFHHHFPLFLIKKLKLIELSDKELEVVKQPSEATLHRLIYRNVFVFCTAGRGLEVLMQFFTEERERSHLSLIFAQNICNIIQYIKPRLKPFTADNVVTLIRPKIYRFLAALPIAQIRDNKSKISHIQSSISEPLENSCFPIFDSDLLSLVLKYISSSILTLKLDGLGILNQPLYLCMNQPSKSLSSDEKLVETRYSDWIIANEIIERIHGRPGDSSAHPELLKHSQIMFVFLASQRRLTTDHMETLWEGAMDKHSSRHVFQLLHDISKYLEEILLKYLLHKLTELPAMQHSFGSLQLCTALTQHHWKQIYQGETDFSSCSLQDNTSTPLICDNNQQQAISHISSPLSSSSRSLASNEAILADDHAGQNDPEIDVEPNCMDISAAEDSPILPAILQDPSSQLDHISTGEDFKMTSAPPSSTEAGANSQMPHTPSPLLDSQNEKLVSLDKELSDTTHSTQPYSVDTEIMNSITGDENELSMYTGEKEVETSMHDTSSATSSSSPSKLLVQTLNSQGNSLLWDLLQDDKISQFPIELRDVAQKYLGDLIKLIRNKEVTQHFVKACVTNLSLDRSIIISLNLILSLLTTYPPLLPNSYCIFTWAQTELGLINVFFQNWRRFIQHLELSQELDPVYPINVHLDTRLNFLSNLCSPSIAPKNFQLSYELLDELWKSLVMNDKISPNLRNTGFMWFEKQVQYMPEKTISQLIESKINKLDSKTISHAGFNLVKRLFFANQGNNFKLGTDHPCLELIWKIALSHNDSLISADAIELFNTSYVGRMDHSLELEKHFVEKCISFLEECLKLINGKPLTGTTEASFHDFNFEEVSSECLASKADTFIYIRRALDIIISHLDLFHLKYAFQIRLWKHFGIPIKSHCHQKFPGLTERLGLQAMLRPKKTENIKLTVIYSETYRIEIEVPSSSLLAELRADVIVNLLDKSHSSSMIGNPDIQNIPSLKLSTETSILANESDSKSLRSLDIKDKTVLYAAHISSIQNYFPYYSQLSLPNKQAIPDYLLSNADTIPLLLNLAASVDNEPLARQIWKLLTMLPTSPQETESAMLALTHKISDWQSYFGSLDVNKYEFFKRFYSLQVVQGILLTKAEEKEIPLDIRRVGLTVCLQYLEHHMKLCISVHKPPLESFQSISNQNFFSFIDKENINPSDINLDDDSVSLFTNVPNWSIWHQSVLCYWLDLMSILALQHVILQGGSSASESDDCYIDNIADANNNSGLLKSKCNTEQFELEFTHISHEIILDCKINMLDLLCNTLELGSLASLECATIICNRAWLVLVRWCCYNNLALMELLKREDFPGLIKKLLIFCSIISIRKLTCKNLKKLYSDSEDPLVSLNMLAILFQCSIDNIILLGISQNKDKSSLPYMESSNRIEPLPAHFIQPEELLKQSGECFQCISSLISWITSRMKASYEWKTESFFQNSTYERLVTKAPFELVELITIKHQNRDKLNSNDVFLKGLLQTLASLTKLSTDFTTSSQASHLVDTLLLNLFPFEHYNPTSQYDSPFPVYCNTETRSTAIELLEALINQNPKLFSQVAIVLKQNHPVQTGLPWEYKPFDEFRGLSLNSYVGIHNLGATCYMASTLQQLYMIPPLRYAILTQQLHQVPTRNVSVFKELQRLFLHLELSRRNVFNPDKLFKEYVFDQHLLNPHEQRDMNEFFTDLLSKLEDISGSLKQIVKSLFGGIIANVVASNECNHVSRNCEDFYSVRAKVADMPDLMASLQELTQTDILDGDNKYICSQCGVSVRAEKRACFAQLPSILCINTMRYTFNMSTMIEEKVNTHFSFPFELDMTPFLENSDIYDILPYGSQTNMDTTDTTIPYTKYELVGVVVHSGTAEAGHYYSIMQERDNNSTPLGKWYMFSDHIVSEFDRNHIPHECFGGDLPNLSGLDNHTKRLFPYLIEKNNNAYMLFYQRTDMPIFTSKPQVIPLEVAKPVLMENNLFLREIYTFNYTYLQVVGKMCRHCRNGPPELIKMAVPIATQVLLTTVIHAKERHNVKKWFDWLTNLYREHIDLCYSLLRYLCEMQEMSWVRDMFTMCPNKSREQFTNLLITVLNTIKSIDHTSYFQDFPKLQTEGESSYTTTHGKQVPYTVSVAQLIRNVVDMLMLSDVKPMNTDYSFYFDFLYNFASFGTREAYLLTTYNVITKIDSFYAKLSKNHNQSITLDDGILSLVHEDSSNYYPNSLPLFIHLMLTHLLKKKLLSSDDKRTLLETQGYPLLTQIASSSTDRNVTSKLFIEIFQYQSYHLQNIVEALFTTAIAKESRAKCSNTYKLFTCIASQLTDKSLLHIPILNYIPHGFGPPALPQTINFLATHLNSHQDYYDWVVKRKADWLIAWLIDSEEAQVRKYAALLIINLVPCNVFRENYSKNNQPSDLYASMSQEGRDFVFEMAENLLQLLPVAKEYCSRSESNSSLVQYFSILEAITISEKEAALLVTYFNDFWKLYDPKISIMEFDCHEDKKAFFSYWIHACRKHHPNVICLVEHPFASKNIGFVYILANTERKEIVNYNVKFLDYYYSLLRLGCEANETFARELSGNTNMYWAMKFILPHHTLYPQAVEELYKIINIFAKQRSSGIFRRKMISQCLETFGAENTYTIRTFLRLLIRCEEDAMKTFTCQGLVILSNAYIHLYNKMTQSQHSQTKLIQSLEVEMHGILEIMDLILKTINDSNAKGEFQKEQLKHWKDVRIHFIQKIITNLNSFIQPQHRQSIIQILDYTLKLYPIETVNCLLPNLLTLHHEFLEISDKHDLMVGPYFPQRLTNSNQTSEQLQPQTQSFIETKKLSNFNMFLNVFILECQFGVDPSYDDQLIAFYAPYHGFLRDMLKIAVTNSILIEKSVETAIILTMEALPIRCDIFLDFIYNFRIPVKLVCDNNISDSFCKSNYFSELIKLILFRENHTLCNDIFYEFIVQHYSKVSEHIPEHLWNDVFEVCRDKLLNSTSLFSNLFILRAIEIYIKFNSKTKFPDYLITILSNYITKHLESSDNGTAPNCEPPLDISSQSSLAPTSVSLQSSQIECLSQDPQNNSNEERKRRIEELDDPDRRNKRFKPTENIDFSEINQELINTEQISTTTTTVNNENSADIMTSSKLESRMVQSKNTIIDILKSLRDLHEL